MTDSDSRASRCFFFAWAFSLFVLVMASAGTAPAAHAQAELVVRLEDGTRSSALAQTLRGGPGAAQAQQQAAALDTALARLMQRVGQTRPVFRPSASASGSGAQAQAVGAARQPIPAYTIQLPDSAALRRARQQLAARSDVAYAQPLHLYHTYGRANRPPRSTTTETRRGASLRSPSSPLPRFPAPSLVHTLDPSSQTDPRRDSLRYFPVVRVPEAHEVTTGAEDVLVGVVDTGLFFEHPDFEGQVWVNPGEDLDDNGKVDSSDFNGVDDDDNGFVDDLRGYDFVDRPNVLNTGDYAERDPDPSHDRREPASLLGNPHGTNVAGIIAAADSNGEGILGVAPDTRLVPLRALAGDGAGTDADIAAAIVYAADQGVDVLNFSFGDVYYSRIMEEAVRYAAERGVVMAASAGNNAAGELQEEHYPSDYPEVVSVAQLAVEVTLENDLVLSIPGKYGTGLDLSAPGTGIFTTTLPRALTGRNPEANPDAAAYYERLGGSSFAAPQVTAAAALLRSLDPDLSRASIRSNLTAAAEDLEEDGWDQRTGAGLLDVASTVRRALPARTEITQPASDGGISSAQAAVVGSSLDPSFRSFSVSYARGDTIAFDEDDLDFTRIAGPFEKQVYKDTLAVWNTGDLPEGLYTLRLATRLQDGTTVEGRRRVHIDRSPPRIDPRFVDKGLIRDQVGVLADVRVDDLSTMTMTVSTGARTYTVESNRRARRHGLTWASPSGDGGMVDVTLRATNVAGLTSTARRTLRLPPSRLNTALFEEEELDVPAGLLVPKATDFDDDDNREIAFTKYGDRAARTDSLQSYEWNGAEEGFMLQDSLFTNLFPRDVGNTDGDDRRELLFQIGGASLLIEQPGPQAFPDFSNIAFVDTAGVASDTADALNAALLTDLDTDDRGEILGYDDDVWRIVEWGPDGNYERVATLDNPTRDTTDAELGPAFENGFGVGRAAAGDFDGDGRRGFVAIDNGGDFIVYEAQSDDHYEMVWSHCTQRYAGAGRRVAAGDLDGDGTDEFVTYTRPVAGVNSEVEREPLFGRYYLWDHAGMGEGYRLDDSLSVKGVDFRNGGLADGAMTTADFDDDDRDELVVVDPPALYVFRYAGERTGLVPLFYRGVTDPPTEGNPRSNGLESPVVVAARFGGTPGVVTSAADGRMRRFAYQRGASQAPPPRWVRAAATDEQRARLQWRASGADSVVVQRAAPGEALDRYLHAGRDSSLVDTLSAPRRYALRAYYGADRSPLSESRAVRPQAPPTVAHVEYPSPQIVRLRFTRRLDRTARIEQFTYDPESGGEQAPAGLTFAENERLLALRFEEAAGTRGVLRWQGLESAEGVLTADSSVPVAFPEDTTGTLIVKNWEILDDNRVAITFGAPLAPTLASDVGNYSVTAPGTVVSARYDESSPRRVVVDVAGLRIGPTGRENALTVERMRSRSGRTLAPEGHTIRLSEAAQNLDNVYVYPNPYHAGRHGDQQLTVAGLPAEAEVKVVSVQGTLVRTLEESGSDGGLDWDLTDRGGEMVPAGVYLIRVNAPDAEPVLKKAAVIR
jgi:hypothetical protein